MQAQEASQDPQMKQLFQAALVFWVVFMVKNVYRLAWRQDTKAPLSGEAPRNEGPKGVASRRRRAQRA